MNRKGVDSNARCDKTRQNSFFFPNEKERKLCKKKRRRGKRGEGELGRGEAFALFQRYYKLSECCCYEYDSVDHGERERGKISITISVMVFVCFFSVHLLEVV